MVDDGVAAVLEEQEAGDEGGGVFKDVSQGTMGRYIPSSAVGDEMAATSLASWLTLEGHWRRVL